MSSATNPIYTTFNTPAVNNLPISSGTSDYNQLYDANIISQYQMAYNYNNGYNMWSTSSNTKSNSNEAVNSPLIPNSYISASSTETDYNNRNGSNYQVPNDFSTPHNSVLNQQLQQPGLYDSYMTSLQANSNNNNAFIS